MEIKLKTRGSHRTNRSKVEVKHFSRRLLQFQLQFHFHFHAVYGFSDFDRNADCDVDAARNQCKCLLLLLLVACCNSSWKKTIITRAAIITRAKARNIKFRNAFSCFLVVFYNITYSLGKYFIFSPSFFPCHCGSIFKFN